MKLKITVLILLICGISIAFTKPITKGNYMIIEKENKIDGALHYQKNFKQYTYYIETIGTVSIDKVELKNKELTAIYSYRQGHEIRNVVSALIQDKDGIYKGTCTTTVNKRPLFAVNTWLSFSENGTASGNWSWSGNPTKNDPIVTISFKNN